jgi:hypothetical protein
MVYYIGHLDSHSASLVMREMDSGAGAKTSAMLLKVMQRFALSVKESIIEYKQLSRRKRTESGGIVKISRQSRSATDFH